MIRHFKHIMDGIRVPARRGLRVRRGRQRRARLLHRRRRHRPPVQGRTCRSPSFVHLSTAGRADPRPPDRRHRADLRHDQHDRRGVRQVSTDIDRRPTSRRRPAPAADRLVTLTIDGKPSPVPKGTNVLEAARTLGIDISAFCYHPGLPVVAQCRQCLVVGREEPEARSRAASRPVGRGHGRPHDRRAVDARAQAACSSSRCVNHPIDCPICDKAGECTLQKLYFDHDNADSRVDVAEGPQGQGRRPRAAHRARPGALHPVLALHPRVRRGRRRAPARVRQPRRPRGADHGAGRAARQPVLAQHRRRLPGRRADRRRTSASRCARGSSTRRRRVCNGCATGCNVEIHHKHGRAWRLVPRAQPGRQQATGCATRAGSRTTTCATRSRSPRRASRACPPLGPRDRRRPPSASRVLDGRGAGRRRALGAQSTNEDNFALAKLAARRGASAHVYIAGKPPVPARADGILRRADVNPNTAGVQGDRRRPPQGAHATCADDLKRGALRAAGASATHGVLGDEAPADPALKELEVVIALAAHERGPVAARAGRAAGRRVGRGRRHVHQRQGPRAAHARRAFAPPGQALPGWEVVVRLAARDRLGSSRGRIAARGVQGHGRGELPLVEGR